MAAIYMWLFGGEVLITTTPYPLEAIEKLEIDCAPVSGTLIPIPTDELEFSATIEGGTYIQTRWFFSDGPYDDSLETTHGIQSGTYIQTRWFYSDGPYDDSLETTHAMISATYLLKLVTADSPDEGVVITCTPVNTSSMDVV